VSDIHTLKIIDEKLNRFDSLTVLEKQIFFTELQKIASVEQKTHEEEIESVCPVTKQEVVAECQLKTCRYWVEHSWTKNCALNFMASQEIDALTVEQVSLLFRKSSNRIDSIYQQCFKIVQRHYLRDTLRNKGVPQYNFIPGYCVSCQTRLLEEDLANDALRLEHGHGYCSPECKKTFPPNYFEIEKFFQADFYRIIQVGSELFNFYYLEEILGFQPNVLRNRLEKLRNPEPDKKARKGKKK
jgi:hypothetical protein